MSSPRQSRDPFSGPFVAPNAYPAVSAIPASSKAITSSHSQAVVVATPDVLPPSGRSRFNKEFYDSTLQDVLATEQPVDFRHSRSYRQSALTLATADRFVLTSELLNTAAEKSQFAGSAAEEFITKLLSSQGVLPTIGFVAS